MRELRYTQITLLSMEVGHGASAQTFFPTLYLNNNTNESFFDCPGKFGNRGAIHEIAEFFLIRNLLKQAKRIKIVLVVKESMS